ncbi:Bro-N domain-containing protein [Rothia sp. CCM 9417]|uniref:BRO-N domain-containing protein n=1 Tax=Rothia sp. CCM 9417 TaxID=3402657 RepID=UPI003AE39FC7
MEILANNSAHDGVQTFNFNGLPLRALLIDGEPWFIALDLASILEYRMASDMLRVVDEEDKGTRPMRTPGGTQNLAVISEPAFYKIVVQRQSGRLQKKSSREMITNFQRWVTHEVLPAIRKTGSYAVTQAPELTGPELMAKALVEAQKVLEAKDAQIAQLAPAATAYGHWKQQDNGMTITDLNKKLAEVYPGMKLPMLREHMIKRGELGKWEKKNNLTGEVQEIRYKPKTVLFRNGWAYEYMTQKANGQLTPAWKYTLAYYEELVRRFSTKLAAAGQQEMLEVA